MELRVLVLRLCLATAGGFFASLALVRPSRVGARYFWIHGLGAALVAAAGAALGWRGEGGAAKLALALALLIAAHSLVAATRPRLGTGLFSLGFAAFVGWLLSPETLPAVASAFGPGFFRLNALLSSLLLGITLGAMCLGHWYLVEPKLPIEELGRLGWGFATLSLARFLFSTAILVAWLWGRGETEIYRVLFTGSPGLFVVMRWAWGLLGPLLLAYFVWGTVRIRSTQSATGILYVAVVCVLVGETLSHYLALFHGLPL